MHFHVITLFPEWIEQLRHYGVLGRALAQAQVQLTTINPREFTSDVHRTVDDRPYGGGPGMVMTAEPLVHSIEYAREQISAHQGSTAADKLVSTPVIYLSPQGRTWTQPIAQSLCSLSDIIMICGRYEGIDQRVIDGYVDLEISIGDFVLSGGELPAMLLVDTVTRLIPGVLGHADSASEDSFSGDQPAYLDHPHYTRPEVWHGQSIPDVLKSGNHQQIAHWRRTQAEKNTWQRRPERVKSRA